MRLTISRDTLSSALASVARCSDPLAPSMPILSHVRLAAESGELRLAATDLTLSGTVTRAATVATAGDVCAPVALLSRIVASLPAGVVVTLAQAPGSRCERCEGGALGPCHVCKGAWRFESPDLTVGASWRDPMGARHTVDFKLIGQASHDFPRIPDSAGLPFVAVPLHALRSILEATVGKVSKDDYRAHLCAVYLDGDGVRIRATATDGHRLAQVERAIDGAPFHTGPDPIGIPRDGVTALVRALGDSDSATVDLAVAHGHLFARLDGVTLSVKLVETTSHTAGIFQIAATHGGARAHVATVDRVALLGAVKGLGSAARAKGAGITIGISDGALRVRREDPNLGDLTRDLPATYQGLPVAVSLATRYVLDALSTATDETIQIGIDQAGEFPCTVAGTVIMGRKDLPTEFSRCCADGPVLPEPVEAKRPRIAGKRQVRAEAPPVVPAPAPPPVVETRAVVDLVAPVPEIDPFDAVIAEVEATPAPVVNPARSHAPAAKPAERSNVVQLATGRRVGSHAIRAGNRWIPLDGKPRGAIEAGHPFMDPGIKGELTYYTDSGATVDWVRLRAKGETHWFQIEETTARKGRAAR